MKFALKQENFLTNEECDELITYSEKKGYEEALIRSRDGEVINKSIRDNDRVIWDDFEMSEKLFEQVKNLIPQDIDGWKPVNLNERFRFYRYKDGQRFKPHIDSSYKRENGDISFITLLIYLNEEFEGGSTYLITLNENVTPKKGMLLLFDHKILHAGTPVTSGVKYVLRTDIMYQKN